MGDRQAPAAGSPDAIRPGDPRVGLVLALADDEMVLGHRHSEWTGWAPYLEEDLAFSSIAQDEMAHARVLYELAGPLVDRDVDALALGRSPEEYRHAVICERPNRDWGYSLARHYLYDTADEVRLAALESSSYEELASAVRTIRLEERYHMEHAVLWFRRLEGSPGGAAAFAQGLEAAVGEALAMLRDAAGGGAAPPGGILPGRARSSCGRGWNGWGTSSRPPRWTGCWPSMPRPEARWSRPPPARSSPAPRSRCRASSGATASGCTSAASRATAAGVVGTPRTSPSCGTR